MWFRGLVVALVVAVCGPQTSQAQSFPNKTVRIIVPYAPGGSSDLIARLVGAKLHDRFGKPVIVENKSGANGAIGVEALMASPADGYTIAVISVGALVISPLLTRLSYDPFKDLQPIVRAAYTPLVLTANASLPVKSLSELIAYSKQRPGSLSYSIAGAGSLPHLAGELLKRQVGLDMQAVPYRGGQPAAVAIASGEVPIGLVDAGAILPLAAGGLIRPLAIADPERWPTMPDVPTIAEAGAPGFAANTWIAMFAPAGTPADVVERLNAEITAALKATDVREKLLAVGLRPAPSSPAELTEMMRNDFSQWREVIAQTGIKIE